MQTAPPKNVADVEHILNRPERACRLREAHDVIAGRLVQQALEARPLQRVDATRGGRVLGGGRRLLARQGPDSATGRPVALGCVLETLIWPCEPR